MLPNWLKSPSNMAAVGTEIGALRTLPLPQPLVIRHEEQFVPAVVELGNDDGAVNLVAEVVPLEGRLDGTYRGKRVRDGIEFVVADELKKRTVIGVAAGLGEHVDLRRLMTEFGGIHA